MTVGAHAPWPVAIAFKRPPLMLLRVSSVLFAVTVAIVARLGEASEPHRFYIAAFSWFNRSINNLKGLPPMPPPRGGKNRIFDKIGF